MINSSGQIVDLYIPRKCCWSNKLIMAKDHASITINIGHLDTNKIYNKQFTNFSISGQIRAKGEADSAVQSIWNQIIENKEL
jgi:small subunit ribosomal protein S21e